MANIGGYKTHKNESSGMGRGHVFNNFEERKGVPRQKMFTVDLREESSYLRNLSSWRATFFANSGTGNPSCSRYFASLIISLRAGEKLIAKPAPLSEFWASSPAAEVCGRDSVFTKHRGKGGPRSN